MKGRSKRARTGMVYSRGEINRLIDGVCHPLSKANPAMLMLDCFLHGIVEMNPPLSVKKFLKHNVPRLIEEVDRMLERKGIGPRESLVRRFGYQQSSLRI